MVRTASRPGTHYRMVEGLQKRLASGEKALIANSAYRRYLRRTGAGKAFEVDAGKRAEEARFDGIFVLRANARMTPLNAVLRYRELLMVEDLFRRAKAQLRTRPIYHSCDAAIRGHVFCSFLALVLRKELADRCRTAGVIVEWDDLIRDLDRLQEAAIEKDGKRITTRTHTAGQVGRVFQAVGVALPPNWRENSKRPTRTAGYVGLILSAGCCRWGRIGRACSPMRRDRAAGCPASSTGGVRRAGSAASPRSGAGHRRARPGDRRC